MSQLTSTRSADALALELGHALIGTAECAGVCHLSEDDVSGLHRYEEMVALTDIEHPPGLGWNDNAAEIVDFSRDACVHADGRAYPGRFLDAGPDYRRPGP